MKGKKSKYCILFLVIIVAVAGGVAMSMFHGTDVKRTYFSWDACDRVLVQYLENLLETDLEDYVETVEGRVTIREGEEDDAIIKVKVLAKYEETMLELLRDQFGERTLNIDTDMYDVFANSGVYSDISNVFNESFEVEDWEYIFDVAISGRRVKTMIIRMYVIYDDGMYVYFWV